MMNKTKYLFIFGIIASFGSISSMEKKLQKEARPTTFQDLPDDVVIEIARNSINWNAKTTQEAFKDAINLLSTNKYFNNILKPRLLELKDVKDARFKIEINDILNSAKLDLIYKGALKLESLNDFYSDRKTYGEHTLFLAVDLISKIKEFSYGVRNFQTQEVVKFIDESFDLIKKLSKSNNSLIKKQIKNLLYGKDGNSSLLTIVLNNSYSSNHDLIKKIIDLGVDVNLKRWDGARAIEIAIFSMQPTGIVEFLASKTDPKYLDFLCRKFKDNDYKFMENYSMTSDQQQNLKLAFVFYLPVVCKSK